MKDAELKEKIERIDALAGGVVYGKEEAWEKLQARLDTPAKVITFPYRRVAAAAALLLLIGSGIWYMASQDDTQDAAPTATPALVHETTPAPTNPITTEAIAPVLPLEPTDKKHTATPETTLVRYVNEEPPLSPPNNIPPPNVVVTVEAPIVTTPPPPPIKKMRVVHINDLGRTEEIQEEAIAYNGPTLDISKMKIVSINDIQREEQMRRQQEEFIAITRLNRPHNMMFAANPLSRRNAGPFASTLFSIPLNRKN